MTTEVTTEAAPAASFSPKDLALAVGSDPKTVRRWLRSLTTQRANKGGRWILDADTFEELKDRWAERGTANGTVMTLAEAAKVDDDSDEIDDEEVDELDDIDEL